MQCEKETKLLTNKFLNVMDKNKDDVFLIGSRIYTTIEESVDVFPCKKCVLFGKCSKIKSLTDKFKVGICIAPLRGDDKSVYFEKVQDLKNLFNDGLKFDVANVKDSHGLSVINSLIALKEKNPSVKIKKLSVSKFKQRIAERYRYNIKFSDNSNVINVVTTDETFNSVCASTKDGIAKIYSFEELIEIF